MGHSGTVHAEDKRSSTDIDADRLRIRSRAYHSVSDGNCGMDTRFYTNGSSEYNATHQFFQRVYGTGGGRCFYFCECILCRQKPRRTAGRRRKRNKKRNKKGSA